MISDHTEAQSVKALQAEDFGGVTSILGFVQHFLDGVNGDKGIRIIFGQVIHQLDVLIFVHNGDDFPVGLLVVGSPGLVQGGTAAEM